jgi:hypothetical protein
VRSLFSLRRECSLVFISAGLQHLSSHGCVRDSNSAAFSTYTPTRLAFVNYGFDAVWKFTYCVRLQMHTCLSHHISHGCTTIHSETAVKMDYLHCIE